MLDTANASSDLTTTATAAAQSQRTRARLSTRLHEALIKETTLRRQRLDREEGDKAGDGAIANGVHRHSSAARADRHRRGLHHALSPYAVVRPCGDSPWRLVHVCAQAAQGDSRWLSSQGVTAMAERRGGFHR